MLTIALFPVIGANPVGLSKDSVWEYPVASRKASTTPDTAEPIIF